MFEQDQLIQSPVSGTTGGRVQLDLSSYIDPAFQSICWDCKYGKFVRSKNGRHRCRVVLQHKGVDFRLETNASMEGAQAWSPDRAMRKLSKSLTPGAAGQLTGPDGFQAAEGQAQEGGGAGAPAEGECGAGGPAGAAGTPDGRTQDSTAAQMALAIRAEQLAESAFQTICFDCKYGKYMRSKNGRHRCRIILRHAGPDFRGDGSLELPRSSWDGRQQNSKARLQLASPGLNANGAAGTAAPPPPEGYPPSDGQDPAAAPPSDCTHCAHTRPPLPPAGRRGDGVGAEAPAWNEAPQSEPPGAP